jgi:hypothetical protein
MAARKATVSTETLKTNPNPPDSKKQTAEQKLEPAPTSRRRSKQKTEPKVVMVEHPVAHVDASASSTTVAASGSLCTDDRQCRLAIIGEAVVMSRKLNIPPDVFISQCRDIAIAAEDEGLV